MTNNISNRATDAEAASHFDGINQAEVKREAELRELDIEYKAKKRAINKRIDGEQRVAFDDAKGQGIPKGVLKALRDKHKKLRKARHLMEAADDHIEKLDVDFRDDARSIEKALGDQYHDTPLGQAAINAARQQDPATSAIVNAVTSSMTDEEREKVDRQRAEDAESF